MIFASSLDRTRFQSLFLFAGIFILTAMSSSAVFAASFDCSKAGTRVEKAICADAAVSELDSQLGRTYSDLIRGLPQKDATNLRNEQKIWIGTRNQCKDAKCLSDLYHQRVEYLNRRIQELQYAGKDMEVVSVLEQTYDNAASLVVRFSVPVKNDSDFRRYFEVSKDDTPQPNENWLLSEDGLLVIYPFVDPLSKYRILVKPGLPAINGLTNVARRSFEITTRRSQPSANFSDSGHVMTARLKRAVPVTTLNVDEVDIDIFHIDAKDIPQWSSFSDSDRYLRYQMENFANSNPLVYSGRFPIANQRNQRTTTNLDFSGISALTQEGAYLAVLRVPGRYGNSYDLKFFTVSDIGLQLRKTAQSLHVLSNSIVTGKPLAGIEISLYKNKELRAQQKTDEDGIATFNNWFEGVTTVIARQDKQCTLIRMKHPLDLAAIRNPVSHHQENQVFAWGPRNLYRPGETLEVYALLRDFDGRSMRPFPIKAELVDSSGSSISNTNLNQEKEGAYHFRCQLADDVKTGKWKLLFRSAADNSILYEYNFSVEEFLPEQLKLTIFDGDPTKHRILPPGGDFEIPVAGAYLYGALASGNKVDGEIVAELDRHPFDQWSTFFFGIDRERIGERRHKLDEIFLNDEGRNSWEVSLNPWKDVQSPLALTTVASLYESGGRPVTRSISVTRLKQKRLVGIEPQFAGQAGNDSRPAFKLLLADRDGAAQAGSGYQLVLVKEDRNYYWTYSESSGWKWHYDPEEYESYSSRVQFDGKGAVTVSVPVKWGNYRVEVRDASNVTLSSYRFRTRWCWWGNAEAGAALKPDQVRMTFEDETYHQGDTAHLLITPATEGLATITVENNDKILWVAQQKVSAKGTRVEIPVASDWFRHDIYVTATVLTSGDMVHSVAPKRAFGFINLPIKRQDAEFAVEVKVPEKVQPREMLTATINVSGVQGIPKNTYVTLAAVDVGVLNITRFTTPDPADYFYGARRYDATYYDVYGSIIENAGFAYARQRFGGGLAKSEAELSRGGKKPKSDVQIMSWQSPPVKVGVDGVAQVSMQMPEFNGKVRWMAVAYSDQTFGKADAETTVADKLVGQLSKPRFMAKGDVSQLSLDLSNQSGGDLQFEVEMAVSGAFAEKQWQQSVSLADNGKTTLRFPIQAERLGQGDIALKVHETPGSAAHVSMQRQWFVGVRSAFPAVTRKDQAAIEPGQPWSPQVEIDDLDPSSVQARLVLSSKPPIDLKSQFEHLLHYPYGCAEQSTSSGYPWVLVSDDIAAQMGLLPFIEGEFKQEYTEAFRKTQIEKAVARVLDRQNSKGGFGVWTRDSEEQYWLTAYVTDFLTDAQRVGAEVPSDSLDKALKRLRSYVNGNVRVSYHWSENQDYYSMATRAYAAYVLSKVRRLNLSDLRRFYDQVKDQKSRSALPWIELGYAFDMLGDRERAKAAYAAADNTEYSDGYYGLYGSQLRDMALGYAILAEQRRAEGEMLLKIFDLSKQRRWLSTQERNALFRAAVAAGTVEGDPLHAVIKASGRTQEVKQDETFKSVMEKAQMASLEEIAALDHTVYASLEWVGEYASSPPPYGKGLGIERNYFDLDGHVKNLEDLHSGELVVVQLLVHADRKVPDGLVVDLLPAGLELENQNLANASVDLSKVRIDGTSLDDWRDKAHVQHVEFREDRFVAALSLDNRIVALYYMARAVTPGVYQVPPPYAEDMYRPYYQALGATPNVVTVKP